MMNFYRMENKTTIRQSSSFSSRYWLQRYRPSYQRL